ncbi:MAG: hypothetical protein CR989_04040 [Flavobacteriales bacterium]|nr:MAG: hypothetical protein CR989_04040 [Flavobacteriales bacterium]
MGLNKFEEHIKDAFNNRTIKPSDKAWVSISGQIEKESVSNKWPLYKIAVAADLVGIFISLLIYFNNNSPSIDKDNTIVNRSNKDEVFKEEITTKIKENTKTEIGKIEIDNTIRNENSKTTHYNKEIPDKTTVANNNDNKSQNAIGILTSIEQEKLIAVKISGVVEKVTAIEQQFHSVTDKEIDSLIKQAQEELLRNELFMYDNYVNAELLLAEVEGELDEPFKNKLYKLLKKGIIEARMVIADREN